VLVAARSLFLPNNARQVINVQNHNIEKPEKLRPRTKRLSMTPVSSYSFLLKLLQDIAQRDL